MPISPQITITPEDIVYKSFDITAVTYTSSTATYTAVGHTLSIGDIVMITGLAPDGFNGTYTITSKTTNTFTVANTTNVALTDQSGNVYWTDPTEYEYDGGQTVTYIPNNNDVDSIVNTNASVAAAYAAAMQAQADAATAISDANTALANATTAYNAAKASLQPSASTIVNASNQITAIASNGITVYSGSSSSSGARVVMNSLGLAGYDASNNPTFSISASTGAANFAGSITGSTITGSSLNIAGKFIVGTDGLLQTTDATFVGTITSSNATINGLLTINNAVITGKAYITQGYIGSETTGWNFRSTGVIANNDNTTILYPTGASNIYAMITNRPIAPNGLQSSGDIYTTGNAIINANGTNSNRNYFSYYNTISAQSITGGYGIDSDWAPNSDNTYNLGQATSAGYGSNRRWQRLYSNNTTISTSDVRLKTDVSDSPLGLEFINALRPVNYKWITGRQEVVKDSDGNGIVIGETAEGKPIYQMNSIPGQRLHYGFIAQEVKQALDNLNAPDFAGWVLDDVSDPDSTQSLSYEQFIAPLTKAVQELSARVQALEGK